MQPNLLVSPLCTLLFATSCMLMNPVALFAQTGQAGREANIELRAERPDYGGYGQGEYLAGEPLPERQSKEGVMIGSQLVLREQYDILKRSGYVPFRREMTDAELLAAFTPELRAKHKDDLKALVKEAHSGLNKAPNIPNWTDAWFALEENVLPEKAQKTYNEWFTADGTLRTRDFLWSQPPTRDMLRWAAAYKSTRDEKWARGVMTIIEYYYHNVRPPAGKIGERVSYARHMWRTLNMGALTPGYIEAYLSIQDWPGLTDEMQANFLKGALERGRFLKFTTSPSFPWLAYNPFGYVNWLLYQLQGVLAVGTTFPCFTESAGWIEHAAQGVALHANWCIQPDGSHDEFSYDYAGQVGEQFTWCTLTLLRHGYPLPKGLKENLLRLNEQYLELFCSGDQKIPFGDTHRGESYVRSRAKWASVIYKDARFKFFSEEVDDDFLLAMSKILSPKDPAQWASDYRALPAAPPPKRTSSLLPEVGWSIMRTGWGEHDTVAAIGYKGSDRVAHSAREHLGLNLWVKGRPLMAKLQGEKSYTEGYPAGYINTPKVANLVLIEEGNDGKLAPFAREAGSLRNWHTSEAIDYLDADHLCWAEGTLRARRRLLFLKPDWLLIIDDLHKAEGALSSTPLTTQWQAHIGPRPPTLTHNTARWGHGVAEATAIFLDATPTAEPLIVEGSQTTSYLLKARHQRNPLPGAPERYVTALYIGTAMPNEVKSGKLARLSDKLMGREIEGVTLPTENGPRHIWWETAKEGTSSGRFLFCASSATPGKENSESGPLFCASDEGALPAHFASVLKESEHKSGTAWNGRLYDTFTVPTETLSLPKGAENRLESAHAITNLRAFGWSGQPNLSARHTVPSRVSWESHTPALHSVLYRATGELQWQRQFQPGLTKTAWILLPELAPQRQYDLQAVSEFPNGSVARSEVISRSTEALPKRQH